APLPSVQSLISNMPLRTVTVCSIFFFLSLSRVMRSLPPQRHLCPPPLRGRRGASLTAPLPCGCSILGALYVVNVPPDAELWYGSAFRPVGFLLELSLCQGRRTMQDIRCQVLVIGGGAAAMRAAIAAHDAGADTLIVSKQTPGYSGNSVIARSGHS